MMRTEAQKTRQVRPKRRVGAPRTVTPEVFTPEQLQQIDDMAEAQCKDTMIADVLGTNYDTFVNQFRARTHQKREAGKRRILEAQYKGAQGRGKGAVTERIWFGKQHLEQSDKQDVAVSGNVSLNDAGLALGITRGRRRIESREVVALPAANPVSAQPGMAEREPERVNGQPESGSTADSERETGVVGAK